MFKDNIVYIGRKPVMNYVIAVLTHLNQKDSNEVVLQARGRAISTAVDTAEVTKNRYMPDLTCSIGIGTEKMPREEGGTRNVSTMDITLTKGSQGEDEKEELHPNKETPKPTGTTGEPDDPAKVEASPPEETPALPQDERKNPDLSPKDETPEEEKALTKGVPE